MERTTGEGVGGPGGSGWQREWQARCLRLAWEFASGSTARSATHSCQGPPRQSIWMQSKQCQLGPTLKKVL